MSKQNLIDPFLVPLSLNIAQVLLTGIALTTMNIIDHLLSTIVKHNPVKQVLFILPFSRSR